MAQLKKDENPKKNFFMVVPRRSKRLQKNSPRYEIEESKIFPTTKENLLKFLTGELKYNEDEEDSKANNTQIIFPISLDTYLKSRNELLFYFNEEDGCADPSEYWLLELDIEDEQYQAILRKLYGVHEGTQYANTGSNLNLGDITTLQLYEHLIKATNLAGESFDGPKAAAKAKAEPSKKTEAKEVPLETIKLAPSGM